MCVRLFLCGHLLEIYNLNISRGLNIYGYVHVSVKWSDSEGLLPECSISMKVSQSEDDSRQSTHSNLLQPYATIYHDREGRLLPDSRNCAQWSVNYFTENSQSLANVTECAGIVLLG